MSFEETLRTIIREEVRAAAAELHSAPEARLYTMEQVAKATSVSVASLKRLRSAGCLISHGVGKLARYTVEDVRAALVKHGKPRLRAVRGGR